MPKQESLNFPIQQLERRSKEVESVGKKVRADLDAIEKDMSRAFGDVPNRGFDTASIYAIRYALLWCFTAPLCAPDDPLPVCQQRAENRNDRGARELALADRGPVDGYVACDLPASSNFVKAVRSWSPHGVNWFRERLLLIDRLRVRLKAHIPSRLKDLEDDVHRYNVELQNLNKRAQSTWREAQRVEKRADQRRREEEQWTRFRAQSVKLRENITLIGLDVDRLRDHQRHDVRDIAVRLATLGAEGIWKQ